MLKGRPGSADFMNHYDELLAQSENANPLIRMTRMPIKTWDQTAGWGWVGIWGSSPLLDLIAIFLIFSLSATFLVRRVSIKNLHPSPPLRLNPNQLPEGITVLASGL